MNAVDYFFENTYSLDKYFVLGPKEKIDYRELYNQGLRVANYLKSAVGENQNILLLAPNSVYFITIYLAILKSGNVAVPLNPEIEQGNLSFIQEKCQSKLVFTTAKIASKLNFNKAQILDEHTVNDICLKESQSVFRSTDTLPDQLAEIIFTSGSTGEPKGVMISHKNLIANTASIVEYLGLSRQDIMLVVLPFYYCYGLSLLHTHLRVGGSIVLNNLFILLGSVLNDLQRFNCTGFAGVPSHFQILLRKSDTFKTTIFTHLRYVTQAGGKLHNAFISEFNESHPEIRFYVMYGQTEATARLSFLPPERLQEKKGSCGKAIPGVALKVVDENGTPVNTGETGEILAYGDNIMLGYYKDPISTGQYLKDGWLHTGDLATIDKEGFLYLSARKKEIIKVGGQRISPKEIEAVIVSMPEIIDCTIEGVYDELLGETMKASVVIKENASSITSDKIKAWCAAHLSSFKIPQIIEIGHELVISSTGKKIKK